jgi:hypothetical protein
VLGFDGFEIFYIDNGLVTHLSVCAEEKAAGFETPPGERPKSFLNRHCKAGNDVLAEPDR